MNKMENMRAITRAFFRLRPWPSTDVHMAEVRIAGPMSERGKRPVRYALCSYGPHWPLVIANERRSGAILVNTDARSTTTSTHRNAVIAELARLRYRATGRRVAFTWTSTIWTDERTMTFEVWCHA